MNNKELKDRIKFKIIISEIEQEEQEKTISKKTNIFGKIAAIICVGILASGATFADEISERVYNLYNFRKQYIIETKLPEEIIENEEKLEEVQNNKNAIIPWDENAADIIECDDLEVNITDVAMDDYYLSFKSNINFPPEIIQVMPLENIYLVRFPDLVIRDENNNILFCMEENKLKEIFKTEDLEEIKNNSKYCISEIRHYSFENYSELGLNPYKMYYHLNTTLPSIYPKSKKLIFEFTKIALDSPEASIGIDNKHYLHQDQSLTITGNWKIEIDVSSKYYDREETISYEIIESDKNTKNQLLYCYYKDGLMHAEFNLASEERMNGPWDSIKLGDMFKEINVEPMISNYIIYKVCSSDEYKKRDFWQREVFDIEEYYIENSNGEKSKRDGLLQRVGDTMKNVSKTSWTSAFVKNGILKSAESPLYDYNGWSSPNGVEFDISKEQLTDRMRIKLKYLNQDIEFKIQKMKGEEVYE